MEVLEAIKNRVSIRKYKMQSIEKEKIDRLIEAGRLAPTAGNKQKFKLVVVDDKGLKEKLAVASNDQLFVGTSSHVIIGVTDPEWKWHQVDLAITLEHIVLEAVELGLGTCWIGAFKEDEVKKVVNIPEEKKVVALLAIGYPDESPEHKPRKEINEIIIYNKYE